MIVVITKKGFVYKFEGRAYTLPDSIQLVSNDEVVACIEAENKEERIGP